jgi:hypothetical protein
VLGLGSLPWPAIKADIGMEPAEIAALASSGAIRRDAEVIVLDHDRVTVNPLASGCSPRRRRRTAELGSTVSRDVLTGVRRRRAPGRSAPAECWYSTGCPSLTTVVSSAQ